MAKNKDPAVLFYTADFLADTTLWNYEELGRYIKLLCIQHLQGGISEDDFEAVASDYKRVVSKFSKGEDGYYRNKRMHEESEKRKAFCEKQKANGLIPKQKPNGSQTEAKEKPKASPRVENENINIIRDVITYLNNKLGSRYTYTADYINKHINARLEEGFTYEDFVTVIDKKYKEWHGTDMAKFLRPETLFSTKFQQYLNQIGGNDDGGSGSISGATKEAHAPWSGTWL